VKAFTSFDQLLEIARKEKPKDGFSAIASNPPYQSIVSLRDGVDDSAQDVYHYFYEISVTLSDYTSMIFPGGRWMQRSGGRESVSDLIFSTVKSIDWYPNGAEPGVPQLFENAYIADGLSIVLASNKIEESIILNGRVVPRPKKDEILPLQKELSSIVGKALEFSAVNVNAKKSSVGLFGFDTSWVELHPNEVLPITSDPIPFTKPLKAFLGNATPGVAKRVEEYWIDESSIEWNDNKRQMLSRWKVVGTQGKVSKAPNRVNYQVIDNEHVVGSTWVILGNFLTKIEAVNYWSYISSKTVRKLLEASKGGKTARWGSFVPDLEDYTDSNPNIDWSLPLDPQLYNLFKLTEDEIKIVEGK
jgi:hypothetical protein